MRAKLISDEVLYPDEAIVLVDRADVDRLKDIAATKTRQRVRLCAHRGSDDLLHEMLIVHARDTYVPPHKHPGKSESFHVIDGQVDVVLFAEDGAIDTVMRMGDFRSGLPFYYRIADPIYHTLLIRSETLVFHETTNGPFLRADTAFAPWAPDERDAAAVAAYVAALEQRILAGTPK